IEERQESFSKVLSFRLFPVDRRQELQTSHPRKIEPNAAYNRGGFAVSGQAQSQKEIATRRLIDQKIQRTIRSWLPISRMRPPRLKVLPRGLCVSISLLWWVICLIGRNGDCYCRPGWHIGLDTHPMPPASGNSTIDSLRQQLTLFVSRRRRWAFDLRLVNR